jgi:hypothetical protein
MPTSRRTTGWQVNIAPRVKNAAERNEEGGLNVPVQLEMEKRSPVKIMVRTHEEATETLHAGNYQQLDALSLCAKLCGEIC